MGATLARAADLLAQTHLELTSRGYPSGCVSAAMERARGMADSQTKYLSPSIREQAYLENLGHQLSRADEWCKKMLAALDSP